MLNKTKLDTQKKIKNRWNNSEEDVYLITVYKVSKRKINQQEWQYQGRQCGIYKAKKSK